MRWHVLLLLLHDLFLSQLHLSLLLLHSLEGELPLVLEVFLLLLAHNLQFFLHLDLALTLGLLGFSAFPLALFFS